MSSAPQTLPANFDFTKPFSIDPAAAKTATAPDTLPADFDFGQQTNTPKTTREQLMSEGFLDSAWKALKAIPSTLIGMANGDAARAHQADSKAVEQLDKNGTPDQKREWAKDYLLRNIPLASTIYKAANGNVGGAAGDVVGNIPAALLMGGGRDPNSPAARVADVTGAAAKAGVPSMAGGAAMIAAGEGLGKIPGMEWPARIGMGYPGVRLLINGAKQGLEAGRAALKPTAAPNIGSWEDLFKSVEVPDEQPPAAASPHQPGWQQQPSPTPASPAPAFKPARDVQLPSGRVPGTGEAKPSSAPTRPDPSEPSPAVPSAPGMTPEDRLRAEFPSGGQTSAEPAAPPPEELTPGQVLAKSVGQDWKKLTANDRSVLEHVARAQQNSVEQSPVSPAEPAPTSTAGNEAAPTSPETALPAQPDKEEVSFPRAESPQSQYDANGDLKSRQQRNIEILTKNVRAKEDRFSQALFDNGVTPTQVLSKGWTKITDQLVSKGALQRSEVPPNLSSPGILTKLKELQSQKIAQDLQAEMQRSGTIPQQQQQQQ